MDVHPLELEWHEYACVGCEAPYTALLFLPTYAEKQRIPRFARDVILPLSHRFKTYSNFLSQFDRNAYNTMLELFAQPRSPSMQRIMRGMRTLDWLVLEASLGQPTPFTLGLAGLVFTGTVLGSRILPEAIPLGLMTASFFGILGEQAVRKNPRRMLRVLERMAPDIAGLWVEASMQEVDAYASSA